MVGSRPEDVTTLTYDSRERGDKVEKNRENALQDTSRCLSVLDSMEAELGAVQAGLKAKLGAGAEESQERCTQLISGSIEAGDRRGAEKWLATCDVPRDEAQRLLAATWLQRWGETGPPAMVQGVPEAE